MAPMLFDGLIGSEEANKQTNKQTNNRQTKKDSAGHALDSIKQLYVTGAVQTSKWHSPNGPFASLPLSLCIAHFLLYPSDISAKNPILLCRPFALFRSCGATSVQSVAKWRVCIKFKHVQLMFINI